MDTALIMCFDKKFSSFFICLYLLFNDKLLMLFIRQSSVGTYIIFIALRTQITKYFRMGILLKASPPPAIAVVAWHARAMGCLQGVVRTI